VLIETPISTFEVFREARSAAQEVQRVNPKFSVAVWAKTMPYRNRERLARFSDTLRKAGLK
jgi:hypothetical protein